MPPTPTEARKPRPTSLASLVFALASAGLLVEVFQGSQRLLEAPFPGFLVLDNGTVSVFRGPGWSGFASGLPRDGAVVVAVDGEPFRGGDALLRHVAERPPGTPIRYGVRHRGQLRVLEIPSQQLSREDYVRTVGGYLFIAFSFLVTGALALALQPGLPTARALALTTGAVGALFALAVDHLTVYRFVRVYQVVEGLVPAAVLHLGLVFPVVRLRERSRRRWVRGVALVLGAIAAVEAYAFYARPETAHAIDFASDLLFTLAGLGLIVSFGEAFLRARRAEERMRAGVVFAGGLLLCVPTATARFGSSVLGWQVSATPWTPLLLVFLVVLLYALLRQNVLETERVVRLGVTYAVATAAAFLIYAAGLLLLSRWVWPDAPQGAALSFLLVLVIAVAFEPLRRRVQRGIDRAFYRSRIDVGHELEESGAELASLASQAEIARFVSATLRERLALEWAELRSERLAGRAPRVSEPVAFRGEVLGVLACGPKQSGAPFSATERELVKGLASQTALALHNARAIQALRDAQRALLRSERLASIGQFAGAVAHGIRNPLAGIRASAQVGLAQVRTGPLADTLSSVLVEADRLDHRIRTLLDFSRPYQPSPQPTDLSRLLDSVRTALGPQALRQGVSIDLEAPPELFRSEVDPNSLEEALLELVSNALRAMSDGGKLRLALASRGGRNEIRVADSGPGIPEGVRHRIFDLFFTTRCDGTGVGLATVRKIVEQNHGSVELESSGPGGSVFRIDLPATSA